MNWANLGGKKYVKILQISWPFANVLQVVVCGMVGIKVQVLSVAFFTREK